MHRSALAALAATCLALLPVACDREPSAPQGPQYGEAADSGKREYVFAVHPLHNPQMLDAVFTPLMDYLDARIPGANFRLEASRDYAAYNDKLYARKFEFALPNPYQTVKAVEHGYRVFAKMGNDDDFRGIFIVRKDSDIREVADLRGKAVSYPAPTALAACMLPQYFLHGHGLDVMRDIDNRYVGSQESSIMNAYLGNVAAGATWPPPWRHFQKSHPREAAKLEVRWETPILPNNSFVVRDDVPADLAQQVATLLTSLHEDEEGRRVLLGMETSRIDPATSATYDPVRAFLAEFARTVRPPD